MYRCSCWSASITLNFCNILNKNWLILFSTLCGLTIWCICVYIEQKYFRSQMLYSHLVLAIYIYELIFVWALRWMLFLISSSVYFSYSQLIFFSWFFTMKWILKASMTVHNFRHLFVKIKIRMRIVQKWSYLKFLYNEKWAAINYFR